MAAIDTTFPYAYGGWVPEPDCKPPRTLWGGGVRAKHLTVEDLAEAVDVAGVNLNLVDYEYTIKAIIRTDRIQDPPPPVTPGAVTCKLAFDVLEKHLNVDELRDFCLLHALKTTALHRRMDILHMLQGHVCDEHCEDWAVVLHPCERRRATKNSARDVFLVTSEAFAAACKTWPIDAIHAILPGVITTQRDDTLKLHAVRLAPSDRLPNSEQMICIRNVPLDELAKRLTIPALRSLAAHHGINMPKNIPKSNAILALKAHKCVACAALDYYFVSTSSKPRDVDASALASKDNNYVWPAHEPNTPSPYPPQPTSMRDVARAMRGYCAALQPGAVEEDACACCAQLTPRYNLLTLNVEDYDGDLLCQTGASRMERATIDDPCYEHHEPLLLPGVKNICNLCDSSLKQGLRPQMALANFLWLGEVPAVLKDLTLAEQSLISRVRYNRCVVRISSGHAKMVANVIAFEHPTMKVYNRLPISVAELDEILAVVFTGVNPPTDADLKRTPVLVRRRKVQDALEWLKINNPLYTDLEIDYSTLNSYPEANVPVGVLYNKTAPEEGNVPDAAKSQFDDDDEIGTSTGPCPFTVHGLTSERFTSMSTTQRKAAAIQHLKSLGSFLAVGHDDQPQSLYDNPHLYPKMFPWLFPYGHGGIGQQCHKGRIAKDKHLKWLLMYHNKRFQEDAGFIIVAFNHQLIKQGTLGSFLMVKRGNFLKVAEDIGNLNSNVLASIAQRMQNGERVLPETAQEKLCFSLLDQIEYVGTHVDGSISSKKFQRNELWSLVAFANAPNWFLTSSFVDNKHPLCIYFADHNITFRPEIKGYAERQHLITRNPVACARFFNYLVKLFIEHLCGWSADGPSRGLYGQPSAYYGTVEQQGRMTLHLHCLLWIDGAPTPQVLRERLMSEDSEFQKDILAYLESCHVGEFMTGSKEEVSKRVPLPPKNIDKGIHTILVEEDEHSDVPPDYEDPTQTLPEAPPNDWCEDDNECSCDKCVELSSWYERFKQTVDDILLRSNIHKCFGKRDGPASNTEKPQDGRVPKRHATGKGCINKEGVCTARFPRTLYMESNIDAVNGHINLKKREEWMNNITPALAAASRCNTDTTCLLSGTAIKATVGYVTDYITKSWLKTYQVFSTMYDSFNKNADVLQDDNTPAQNARKMIIKIVNSLSAKMEIGAPMAALYLLDNPDRYTSHEFVPFYWKNFVTYVEEEWRILAGHADPGDTAPASEGEDQIIDVGVERVAGTPHDAEMDNLRDQQTVQIRKANGSFVGKSSTDDYRFRPIQHEAVNLYEWIQCSVQHRVSHKRGLPSDLPYFKYSPSHPMVQTHLVACDPTRRDYVVPNFIGPAMPRPDAGDREVYCCTMLVFFRPWRTGVDLKSSFESWEDAFNHFPFTNRQKQLMANFNVRYECYDAKDDYASLYRKSSNDNDSDDDAVGDDGDGIDVDEDIPGGDPELEQDGTDHGPAFNKGVLQQQASLSALKHAGWIEFNRPTKSLRNQISLPRIVVDEDMTPTTWRAIIRAQRLLYWRRRFAAAEVGKDGGNKGVGSGVRNDVYVVPAAFLSKDFIPPAESGDLMAKIVAESHLNQEQEKAFRIVANHATCIGPEQLLMYLGGMGGTGKSRVIRSLETFFKARGEPYRFILLAPTGTAAALIGGTTYHSFLGLRTGTGTGDDYGSISDLIDRLRMVGYILLDEVSMVNVVNLCRISARLCEALQVFEIPFGGLNVILAGDFAQLPPAGVIEPLYSRAVPLHQSPRQLALTGEKTIGRTIWMQFTTAVILKENMRQVGAEPAEVAFRRALENLRYHACTDQDIALLRSRITGPHSQLTVDGGQFKNVSIITARNLDKDHFNASQSAHFAKELGYELEHFYSFDKLSTSEPKRQRFTSKGKKYSTAKSLTSRDQVSLWEQPPSTSDHVPGKLSLCRGMPVIIRYNDATELCITRGQEAVVVGWTYTWTDRSRQRKRLEVLYLQLVNPPHDVQVPNLPRNIIPMTRMAQTVDARLPSDLYLRVSRSQVPVLPNFAMTDYSSQGKTREFNVVDLKNCQNFQAAYTCLSRGTSLAGTVILREFPTSKLKGKIDGELRQEFRELNYLDEITDLRYKGLLPIGIAQSTRWATINRYKAWARPGVERTWHPIIRNPTALDNTEGLDVDPKFGVYAKPSKRKSDTTTTVSKRRKQTRGPATATLLPLGPVWDAEDYSCAYDAWTAIMYTIWQRGGLVVESVRGYSHAFASMIEAFDGMSMEDPVAEVTGARNTWRQSLRSGNPTQYPVGKEGADMYHLSGDLLGCKDVARPAAMDVRCQSCIWRGHEPVDRRAPWDRYFILDESPSIHAFVDSVNNVLRPCPQCGDNLSPLFDPQAMVAFELRHMGFITLNERFEMPLKGCYKLAGVIYFGDFHFVSRVIQANDKVYMHDGLRGAYMAYEGLLKSFTEGRMDLLVCNGKRASIAIYVLEV